MAVPYVVVAGGIALDLKARPASALVRGTSNRGSLTRCPGGVARNIAENLARLGTPAHLVGAVADDPLGAELLAATQAAGVTVVPIGQPVMTGTYTALLDEGGELVAGVADLAGTESLEPRDLTGVVPLVAGAALVVADANLPAPVLRELLARTREAHVPMVMDPVSVPKAVRVATVLDPAHPVRLLTPNRDELHALTGHPVDTLPDVVGAARRLCAIGAEAVWVRLGPEGSVLVPRASDEPLALAAYAVQPVDVTGAGDAQLAGLCHRLVVGDSLEDAAAYGQAMAALTVTVPESVRPDLSPGLVADFLDSARKGAAWRS